MRTIAVACALAGLGLAQPSVSVASDSSWMLGPAANRGWDAGVAPAGTMGYLGPSASGAASDTAYGLQLSLSCPWLQPPSGSICQQVDVNHFDSDGVRLTSTEMNPRYFMDVAPGLALGLGPGLGYVRTDADAGKSANLWAVQMGADLDYRQGPLFMGVGTRYQWTESESVGGSGSGVDNWLTTLKLGVKF